VILLGATSAEAVPSVTFKCTPAPQDCSGWFRSPVAIDWTVIPSDAAVTGCQDKSFTTDTPGTNEFCSADDGSATVTVQLKIKVDQTAPIVTGGQPARGADVNGWYNHAVAVAFTGSDLTSGIETCTATTYGGPDSATASIAGTCLDRAGNTSAPLPYGLKYDETAPTVTAARPERPPNANGWFNRAVRFDVEGADATSGISDCTPVTYGGPDSATASVTGTCRDRAGNAAGRAFALKYDATAPAVMGGQAARGADVNGWYNRPVAVSFTGADQLSGVDACTAVTYSGPDGAGATVPGTCTDKAGNVSAPLSFGLRYDGTKPVVTGSQPARAADANGWYNRAVSVAFSGSDPTAGIESCSTASYAGPDSGAASLAGTCTDRAGNVSSPFGYGLKFDATAPAVTGAQPERAANAGGWFNRSVVFAILGTDATSGVAECPAVTYGGPDSATASVTGSCRDHAGNSSSRAFTLKYDATAPTATRGDPARAADVNGWYNRPVSVAFSGTDQLSGLDTCATVSYSGPDGAAASVPGTCSDKAGNVSAPLSHQLKYDATAPTVTGGNPARAADANGWYNHAVTIGFAGTDPVSGVDACTSSTYAGPDTAAASVGGTCTDKAGNASSPLGFALKYDSTAPQVTGTTPRRSPDAGGWYNRAVAFDFDGADATSGIAACPPVNYSGPDGGAAPVIGRCTDRAGNVSDKTFAIKYDGTAPAVSGATPDRPPDAAGWYNRPVVLTFGGGDATSGIDACTTRTYGGPDSGAASVPGTCTDKAGNVSGVHAHALRYDATAPAVTNGEPARPPDANGWYNHAVPVVFGGADATSGVDACATITYRGPDTPDASVSGTCGDRAGNVSGPLGVSLKYDETGPVVTGAEPERPPDHAGWFVSPVRFDVTGTDATSGLEGCPAVTYTGPDGAGSMVTAACLDRAGNATRRAFALNYDATPPLLTSVVAASGDRTVSLTWQTSPDAESVEILRTPGVDGLPASVLFRGAGTSFVDVRVENGLRYDYELRVRDSAGNARAQTVSGVPAAPAPGVESVPGPVAVQRTPPSITPPPRSVLAEGERPLLGWPRVKRASYYNVQLFRGGRKILSAWPKKAHYRLKLRWTFRGERQRLTPGRYRWMVWPGFGRRSRPDFGERIVRSTFRVVRASRGSF
jgi:large repetitive protein